MRAADPPAAAAQPLPNRRSPRRCRRRSKVTLERFFEGGRYYRSFSAYYLSDMFHTLVNCPWWVLGAGGRAGGVGGAAAVNGCCALHTLSAAFPPFRRYRFYLLFVFFYIAMVSCQSAAARAVRAYRTAPASAGAAAVQESARVCRCLLALAACPPTTSPPHTLHALLPSRPTFLP